MAAAGIGVVLPKDHNDLIADGAAGQGRKDEAPMIVDKAHHSYISELTEIKKGGGESWQRQQS
ncbi:hypothetical protein [Erythrobacter sp. EC-HK427]|uniref:hypothetical protein n=1 Tax=Erythrobacter sp. EC-HK427 TaxID=2038396 RepID=UPI00125FCA08|nr:hypothetical protein [Erythrobacter sp. EC-HK427]